MELRLFRYFQAVAEELSFTGAARRLRIAQPALSRAVQELESELGVALLDRNRRLVRLTPAGTVLLRETGILLERMAESLRRVRRTANGEEGELRLGYIGPPTRAFLGELIGEYRRRFPRVTVVLEERTPERVWEMVSQGRLSVALTRPVLAHEALGLRTLTLREEAVCAIVHREHRFAKRKHLAWHDLRNEAVVLLARREGASSHDVILAACQEARFTPHITHTPSQIGTVLQYVEAGAGIGIVPESAATPGPHLIPIALRPRRHIALVLVWAREGDDPTVAAFRELVREWLGKNKI